MPTPLRRRWRLARRGAGYTAAVLLVLVALVLGVANQLLPLAERHPERIASWLSERTGQPIAFDRVATEWTRRGPLLRLDGLRVGAGGNAIAIGEAEMLVSLYAGMLPDTPFSELRLRGLSLTLERSDDGRWQLRGLPGQRPGADPLRTLQGLGELQVIDGKLAVIAPSLGIDARLPRVDLRLRIRGDRVRAGMRAWIRNGTPPLNAMLDFDRERGNGHAYLGAKQVDLAVWSPLLQLAGVRAERGRGRAEAWAELRGHRIAVVTFDALLDAVRLRGAPRPDAQGAIRTDHRDFTRLQARARWRAADGVWRLDAPILRIGAGQSAQTLDGLVLAGGRRYALLAERIDAGPLFALLALSDRLTPAVRDWLVAARPAALLRDVEIAGERGGKLHANGRIEAAAFSPVGRAPGLRGIAGSLRGDDTGFAFAFDPRSPVQIHWPRSFQVRHKITLRGGVSGWRDDKGWRVATSGLRIDGEDSGADLRGGVWFQGDGTRPRIDLAAQLDDMALSTAREFWVRDRMPPATIRWLDAALLSGRVRDGRVLIAGDLDDWPFAAPDGDDERNAVDGVFAATARIDQALVRFNPDWPAAQQVDAQVSFRGDSVSAIGKGMLAGVGISRFSAGIAHWGRAELQLQAEGGGDASDLLALLRQSPLRKQHGETLASLSASGPATATLDLQLPLHRGGGPLQLAGKVELRGARLAESRWKLAFQDVRGSAGYDRHGFSADGLRTVHEGQPGRLSLHAGAGHVRDPRHAFEAELEAVLSAQQLLERAPQLDWLKSRVQGRSPWTIAIAIPKSAQASPNARTPSVSRLQLRSTLVGTTLNLPAPLRKPAATALATTVDTSLPLGQGEIAVVFGQRLALRARSAQGQTGVRAVLGADRVAEAPPSSGLIASGRTDLLDAIDWATLTRGSRDRSAGSQGSGLPLRQLDVSADRLLLLGAGFPNIRVRALPAAAGTAVQLEGAGLAGSLLLPRAEGATLAGKLQRLHWRVAKPTTSTAQKANAGPTAGNGDAADPSAIPPLNLTVDDLRFGDARLGAAILRTRPVPGGLRIEQLQAHAPQQRIDVGGDWLGRGAAARTRLEVDLASDDLGALLAGLGFGGRIAGGNGKARFNAAWPGSPAAFKLETLDGSLTLAARNGRLVQIEPGAGRVLGLLSLTELPRRLTLDFRDFFSKGFSFNKIDGDVRFGGGTARSENLLIEGPAAEIRIRGSADLRAQTYDQTIEVQPRTGNLLTVAGAIAGGPVGAAIGAAANMMLRKPLGQMAAKTYRVTGPWKEPKVDVVERERGRSPPKQPTPAG